VYTILNQCVKSKHKKCLLAKKQQTQQAKKKRVGLNMMKNKKAVKN